MKKLAHTELQLGMKVKSRKMSRLGQQAPLIDAEVVGLTPNLVCISAKFETQTINCILFRRENGNLVDDSNLEVAIYG